MAAINRNVSIRETSTGPSIPPLVPLDLPTKQGVSSCNTVGQAGFRALLQAIVNELMGTSKGGEYAKVSPLFAGVGEAGLGAAKATVLGALCALVRSGKEEGEALGGVTSMGFAAPLAKDLVEVALGRRGALQEALDRGVPRHPGLHRLRWRMDVAISSSSLAKVMRTVLLMEVTNTEGRVVSFEVPPERFAELRYGVAKALQESNAVYDNPLLK